MLRPRITTPVRWFSTTLPGARARVEAIDSRLVLLRPNNLQDTGRLKPGAVFRSDDGTSSVVAAFKLRDAIFGVNLSKQINAGMVLTQNNDEEIKLQDSESIVFADPPRDMARRPITQSWFINEPAMDLMTPIGIGQSMIFFLHNDSKLFDTLTTAFEQQQVPIFFSEDESPLVTDDKDVSSFMQAYTSITRAESKRDEQDTHVVMMVQDLTAFRRIWDRAESLWRSDKSKRLNDNSFLTADAKPDRTDLRHYYSSFIQRAARLKDGNKSLTLLIRVPRVNDELTVTGQSEFTLDEFASEVKAGIRLVEDFERLVRIKAKLGKKIQLNVETLKKLNIALPASAGGGTAAVKDASQAKMHAEELMSIVDGHIVAPASFKDFCLDPRASLTRIGVGSNKNEVRDTRPALIRSLASGLRIEVVDLYESVHANPEKAKAKLEAWQRSLNQRSPLAMESDRGRYEAALVYATRMGMFNNKESRPEFDLDAIKELDLDRDHEPQLELLKRCIKS